MIVLALILGIGLITGCSAPRGSDLFQTGNPNSLVFEQPLNSPKLTTGGYYAVKKDKDGRIRKVWRYNPQRQVTARYEYDWEDTTLLARQDRYFNQAGKLRSAVKWILKNGRPVEKHETYYDFQGLYEKLEITYVNPRGQPAFIETYGEGRKLVSTTELYYDPAERLDKKQVVYYTPDGNRRDFWVTLYTNFNTIRSEEHYLSNGTLIAFYRNEFDPNDHHLTRSESFSEESEELVIKDFDASGRLIREEFLTRNRRSKGWQTWSYDEKPGVVVERKYNGRGVLLNEATTPLAGDKPALGDLKSLLPKSKPD